MKKTRKMFIVAVSLAMFLPIFIAWAEENASREVLGVIGFVKSEFKTDVSTCLKNKKVDERGNYTRVYCNVNLLEDDDFDVIITRKDSVENEPKQRKSIPFFTDKGEYAKIDLSVNKRGYRVETEGISKDDSVSEENFSDALTLLFRRYPTVFLEHTLLLPYRSH